MDQRTPSRSAQREAGSGRRSGHQATAGKGENRCVGTLLAPVTPQACQDERRQEAIDQSKESKHLNPQIYAAAQQTCTAESVKRLCRKMVKNVPRRSSSRLIFRILRAHNDCVDAAFGRFEFA